MNVKSSKSWYVQPVIFALMLTVSSAVPKNLSAASPGKSSLEIHSAKPLAANLTSSTLKVLTLNVAHGRGDSFNQVFLGKKSFDNNLKAISQILRRAKADIVALQEVDKSSLWSGRFDHGETIASQAGYPWKAHAEHAKSWFFNFGTAVLSRLPIHSVRSKRFAPSPPTLRKGFVVSQVNWANPRNPLQILPIDVVSVHLDFASEEVRASQIEEMVNVLSNSTNPMIVLGDFNSEWHVTESPVQALVSRLELKAFQPGAKHLATHENTRIDWILLSPALSFKNYSVLPDIVSDHQAVLAEVEFTEDYLSSLNFKAKALQKIPTAAKVVRLGEVTPHHK